MSQVSSTRCEVCDEPLIMFSWDKGDVVITFECGECGTQKSVSLDEMIEHEKELTCCGKKLYQYNWLDDDVVLLVGCTSCPNSGAVSVSDGMDALGDEEEDLASHLVN